MKKNNIITFKKNEPLINIIKKLNSQLKENFIINIVKENNSAISTDTLSIKYKERCDCCNTTINSDDYTSSDNSRTTHSHCYNTITSSKNNESLNSNQSRNSSYSNDTTNCYIFNKTKINNKDINDISSCDQYEDMTFISSCAQYEEELED
jgi:hypothetical protein